MNYLHSHFTFVLDVARSIIEIAILAAGFYYMWKLFRGTRGARVLAGFGLILATMSLLAVVLQLTVIEKLLSF